MLLDAGKGYIDFGQVGPGRPFVGTSLGLGTGLGHHFPRIVQVGEDKLIDLADGRALFVGALDAGGRRVHIGNGAQHPHQVEVHHRPQEMAFAQQAGAGRFAHGLMFRKIQQHVIDGVDGLVRPPVHVFHGGIVGLDIQAGQVHQILRRSVADGHGAGAAAQDNLEFLPVQPVIGQVRVAGVYRSLGALVGGVCLVAAELCGRVLFQEFPAGDGGEGHQDRQNGIFDDSFHSTLT